ncbi:TatD family hydrolase [Oceanivirga miroungae]|uniref:TatD family hydrolase n=1 Tax=Oceanivirga miroungae TaxID=1130046 RepID=A0A6I8MC17_9FUSO|nr:TatD family hydrolase [Oceanivirga miroungae]VWL85763.1 TatD family hydrolase [Oceanivirga miroungae]
MYKLVDSHCHVNDIQYKDNKEEIIKEIKENMEFVVCSGWDYDSSIEAINIANENDNIYASIGFHPTDISKITDEKLLELENLAKTNKKIVGIGEIGLDYHWMTDEKEVQKKFFRMQIELAKRVNKAVVIHTREALADTIEILDEYKDVYGVLHCYPGSYEAVLPILDRYYVSVGGVLTFKNGRKTKEMLSKVPIEKVVLETDSPYLTPTPFRGRINKPIYTHYVAEEIARIKEMSYQDVIDITTKNAYEVYKICK